MLLQTTGTFFGLDLKRLRNLKRLSSLSPPDSPAASLFHNFSLACRPQHIPWHGDAVDRLVRPWVYLPAAGRQLQQAGLLAAGARDHVRGTRVEAPLHHGPSVGGQRECGLRGGLGSGKLVPRQGQRGGGASAGSGAQALSVE